MKDVFVIVTAAAAAWALMFVLKEFYSGSAMRRDPGASIAVVIVVLGGLLYDARILPQGQVTQLSFMAALLGCLVLSIAQSRKGKNLSRQGQHYSVFLPVLIASVLFLTNAVMNPGLPLVQSLGRLLAVAIVLILAIILLSGNITLRDTCHLVAASVLFLTVISPIVDRGWRECDIFKCGPFNAIYTGPFPSENAYAIYAAIAMISAFHLRRGVAALTVFPLVLVLFATESRTSQLALGVAVFGALSLWLWRGVAGSAGSKPRGEAALSAGQALFFASLNASIMGVGLYLITHATPSLFSNRGNIWLRGTAALGDSWFTGLGLDRWTFLQTIGLLPPLFPHSEYLLLLFGGGATAVSLLTAMMIVSTIKARYVPGSAYFAVAYTLFLAVLGLTEAYWNPATFDGHTMLIVPLMLLLAGQPTPRVPTDNDLAKNLIPKRIRPVHGHGPVAANYSSGQSQGSLRLKSSPKVRASDAGVSRPSRRDRFGRLGSLERTTRRRPV